MTDSNLAPLGPVGDYAELAEKAYTERQSANARFREARAASEAAALRELVFTAASYGVTRLLLEPSDQGDYMTVSEIEPEVEAEAEDYISDSGSYDLSDDQHADWLTMAGVEQTEFNIRSEQIRKASIDIKVAAEALIAATVEHATRRVETVMFGNDRLDALDGWQGDAWAITEGDEVISLHLDRTEAERSTNNA